MSARVKAEMFFDRQRQDGDDCRVIARARRAEDDDAPTVLAALLLSGTMFVMPEVCVIQDKTRLRRRYSHASHAKHSR